MTIRDRDTVGALAGIGAVLVRDGYSFAAKQIGLAKFYFWQNAGGFFMGKDQVKTALGSIVGGLADITMGAILGVVFVLFLRLGRDRNIILKGCGFGLGAWLLLFGLLMHTLPETRNVVSKDALSVLSNFIGHTIFGLTLGLLASRLLRATDTGVERED